MTSDPGRHRDAAYYRELAEKTRQMLTATTSTEARKLFATIIEQYEKLAQFAEQNPPPESQAPEI